MVEYSPGARLVALRDAEVEVVVIRKALGSATFRAGVLPTGTVVVVGQVLPDALIGRVEDGTTLESALVPPELLAEPSYSRYGVHMSLAVAATSFTASGDDYVSPPALECDEGGPPW